MGRRALVAFLALLMLLTLLAEFYRLHLATTEDHVTSVADLYQHPIYPRFDPEIIDVLYVFSSQEHWACAEEMAQPQPRRKRAGVSWMEALRRQNDRCVCVCAYAFTKRDRRVVCFAVQPA